MYDLKKQIETASTAIARTLTQEANEVQSLRQFNAEARGNDPAKLAWSPALPIELALKTASPHELKEHYGYNDEEWQALRSNPVFIAELTGACDAMKQEGMTFKMKARLQAEAMLETSWRLVHAPGSEVPANVKADLIKSTARWAGYDSKDATGGPGGTALNIQINL